MTETLYKNIYNELCPDGNWGYRKNIKALLKRKINCLPKTKVADEETKYPTTPAGMRAFLDSFFARHFFQIQKSFLEYMTSKEFLNILDGQVLNIVDIGSGPALASLAITDVLMCIFDYLLDTNCKSNIRPLRTNYILNDTSDICLGTGLELLNNYFKLGITSGRNVISPKIFTIEKPFPSNIGQLKRISQNIGAYNIITFSYVINPLNNEKGFNSIIEGLASVQTLGDSNGRVLIVQDKFSKPLLKRIARKIGQNCYKAQLRQHVYSKENSNDFQSYVYYYCLFAT